MRFNLINRGGKRVVRHWDGSEESGGWTEIECSQSTRIEKSRIGTRVALEVARLCQIRFDPDLGDIMHQVVVGGQHFVVLVATGQGFACYNGEFWYPLKEEVVAGLEEIQLGTVEWKPCRLPLTA